MMMPLIKGYRTALCLRFMGVTNDDDSDDDNDNDDDSDDDADDEDDNMVEYAGARSCR